MGSEANKPYLTKSLFKLASECPRKLFYQTHPHQYENQSREDPFIEGLANGGYQVEGLARELFPNGLEIEADSITEIDLQTRKYLAENDHGVLFQAGLIAEDMAAVFDILNVYGDTIEVIEVKAKSIDAEETFFKNNKKGIKKEWLPYLLDIAFQVHVLETAYPNKTIIPKIALVDKARKCQVDGMNQRFVLKPKSNSYKTEVIRKEGPIDSTLIKIIPVAEEIEFLKKHGIANELNQENKNHLQTSIKIFSDSLPKKEKLHPKLGTHCKKCEFKSEDLNQSGVHECWKNKDSQPLVIDVWHAKQKWIDEGLRFMHELDYDHLENKEKNSSRALRQWLQIQNTLNPSGAKFERKAFKEQLAQLEYPFHFIDFESSTVALPFFKNMQPYQTVAFQYSHHILYESGQIEHVSQYLNTTPGQFPNFDFARHLKKSLEPVKGSIFMYHPHENTVLNHIIDQLLESKEKDSDELIAWLESLTYKKEKNRYIREPGNRAMIDLKQMVVDFYYHPKMRGSNSIKHVFPAIINDSAFLQKKYSAPIYGTSEFVSKNFKDKVWITKNENNQIINPYEQLPEIAIEDQAFDAQSENLPEFQHDSIGNGGAAMMAYAYLQFSEVPSETREQIKKALLQYCELDTLAMAMIMEAWINYDK
ncbi:MAG TPA: DUF2779 domain-containing protein [Oligoflexia bacterium]|nr:DUF2779 domain-containing protein [Oligoflexia bacterium]HMR24680.1 DUF2779 domain-containing protein [Oligoflexia bacterium]